MSRFTENSFVSIGLVCSILLVAFAAGGAWNMVGSTDKRVDSIESVQARFMSEVIDRLARIETEIKKRNHSKEE